MENQTELLDTIRELFQSYKHQLPDVGEAYDSLPAGVYKDGALQGKTKRLMALSASLTHGCQACILFQTEHALNLGASVEEILEACGVAISIGGTMAAGETTRVVKYLGEKGLI